MVDRDTSNITYFVKLIEESRGFGFVTMKDNFLVDVILEDLPHVLDGK